MNSTGNYYLRGCVIFALLIFCVADIWGQENQGSADLDQAFDQKIKAQSTKDLDNVAKLCKSAIEKGLDDEGKIQAEQLAASALYEFADQLSQRIFASRQQDTRWQKYRSDALSRLKKAVEYQPNLPEAYVMIARLNMLPNGDRDEALKAIEKAVEFAGEDREQLSDALFMRASLSTDKEKQLSDLNQAIKINPDNGDAIRVRAMHYLTTEQTDKALEDLDQWLESDTNSTRNYLETAALLMSMGSKFDETLQNQALKIVDKAIEHDPADPAPLVARSQINILREKLDDAVEDVGAAIKLDPDNVTQLILRASIYSQQEKLDEALADVNSALEIEPLLVQGIEMRGVILMQQEKYEPAIRDFDLLAKNDPTDQSLQRQLAILYNANDQPSKSIPIYDKLVELNSPESWEGKSPDKTRVIKARRAAALRGRGDARLSTAEHQKAVDDYEEALILTNELRELLKETVGELPPADDGILNNLAWVLATSHEASVRNGKRAIELATAAAEATEYKQAHILSTLASGYAETGDFENAIKWIEKAIEVNREAGEQEPSRRNTEQQESLQKEFESYQKKEPWRESQNVEEKDSDTDQPKPDEDKPDEDKPDEDKSAEDQAEKSAAGDEQDKNDQKQDAAEPNQSETQPEKDSDDLDQNDEQENSDPPSADDSPGGDQPEGDDQDDNEQND